MEQKIKSLKIAIPFNLVTVHCDSRYIPTMADSTDLIVKVPLSAHTSTMVSDAAVLHTKLLPSRLSCANEVPKLLSDLPFVLVILILNLWDCLIVIMMVSKINLVKSYNIFSDIKQFTFALYM